MVTAYKYVVRSAPKEDDDSLNVCRIVPQELMVVGRLAPILACCVKTDVSMPRFSTMVSRYPVIYLLTWMVPLINGIYTIAVGQSNASFSLVLLATVTSRLQVQHFEGLLASCHGLEAMIQV